MASKENHVYTLRSQATEKEKSRLEDGQEYFTILTDGEILPSALSIKRNEPIRIADVATGTGRWLTDIYHQLPKFSSSQFVGFDISPVLFPPPSTLPPEVILHVHDIRDPFAPEFIASFDVVHAKFLKYAFRKMEWELIVRNLATLLKPGGYLFWEDSDYSLYSSLPTSTAFTEMLRYDIEFSLRVGRDTRHTATLLPLFQEAGLIHCDQITLFTTDEPEQKPLANDLVLRLFSTSLKGAVMQGGVEGCRTDQDVSTIINKVKDEIKNDNLQIIHGMRRMWGQKAIGNI